jgi:CTP:molybdopterin cytidylyltransferase MocA/NifU-like protein involved in Fe-S cluster formation
MNAGHPYGSRIIEHFRRPRNLGPLPNATAQAEGVNPLCGDRVRVAVALDASGTRIETARFTANACAICVAAGSLLTERLSGLTIVDALALSEGDALAMLGEEVPAARHRCATLPLEALRRALTTVPAVTLVARSTVAAVLLAAGSAKRFGGAQKLLAPVPNGIQGGLPLVRESALALRRAGLEHIVLVLGRERELVQASVDDLGLCFATNEEYASGMSSSLRIGVRAVGERWPAAAAVLVALGDQPLMDDGIIPSLVQALSLETSPRVVAPRYRGARGNPVLFAREAWPELLAVVGDRGAREVVDRDPARVAYVDFDSAPPADIDTPADLERFGRDLVGAQQRSS